MAERSFVEEVKKLRMGAGEVFSGEGILAVTVAALRERGVLIVGSGNLVHNLRTMRREAADNQAYDWAIEFDHITAEHITQKRLPSLCDFQQLGAVAQMAHPSWEHYLPLLYAAGAVCEDDEPSFFNEGFQGASISMRSVMWR